MLTPPAALHALLFANGDSMPKKQVAKLLEISETDLAAVIAALEASLRESGVSLVETTEEVELRTSPEASVVVKKLRESELTRDLGKGSLETLAVIAYQAGATRSEVDWVRGVNSSASIRTLLMRGLVEGREDDQDKRRIRYSVTTEALAHIGVSRVDDLPRAEELRASAAAIIAHEGESLAEHVSETE
ncbi:MAG: scpB [Parcubacteria group bacterium]|nr:scpB [Parcubacteria group bacterium]